MRNFGSRRRAAAAWFLITGSLAAVAPLPAQDLEQALRAVVRVRATVPAEATTARGRWARNAKATGS